MQSRLDADAGELEKLRDTQERELELHGGGTGSLLYGWRATTTTDHPSFITPNAGKGTNPQAQTARNGSREARAEPGNACGERGKCHSDLQEPITIKRKRHSELCCQPTGPCCLTVAPCAGSRGEACQWQAIVTFRGGNKFDRVLCLYSFIPSFPFHLIEVIAFIRRSSPDKQCVSGPSGG